ncbi:hypothetical protein P9112_010031 [Eukaryota sp. TZLM1-RC]
MAKFHPHLLHISRRPYGSKSQSSLNINASPPPALTPPSGDTVTLPSSTGSSSVETPQLGTELPSAGEGSITFSQPQGRDTTPSLDVPVVPINLHVPPEKHLHSFTPLPPLRKE